MKKFLTIGINEIICFLQRFNHECIAFLGAGILINLMHHAFYEFQLSDEFQLTSTLRVMFVIFLILIVSSARYCKIFYSFPLGAIILDESTAETIYLTNNVSVFINMVYLTLILSLIFALINYIFSFFLFFLKSDYNKTAYECGFEPFDESMRHPFDIHFYIVGILFLIFDLEISCLVPAAFNVGLNLISFSIVIWFLIIVTIGFVLEYNIGALDWFFIKIKPLSRNTIFSFLITVDLDFPDFTSDDLLLALIPLSFIRLYLVLNFIYLLITTLEISNWHLKKKKREVYTSVIIFYEKLERRIKFMSMFVVLELIYLKIFCIDRTFYLSNKVLAINTTSLSFQLLLIFLAFLNLKQSKGQFFTAKEQFLLFPIFFLSNLFFLSLLLVANHLMVVLIAIMGINLGLYILLFVDTQKNRLESGLKYFFLSIFVIILLYISILLIYLLTYNLDIISLSYALVNSTIFDQRVLGFIYFLLIFVFFFKSGIFPSNFFLPEIYKGLSPVLFLYLTLPIKATFFAFIIKLFEILINNNSYNWFLYVLYIIIIFSFIIGPIGAISAMDLYSFFAYISVTQLGWLLLGLITNQNLNAVLLYYYYYFLISTVLVYIFINDNEIDMSQYSITNFIYGKRHKYWNYLLIVTLITLSGLPPAAAFIPKLYVLISAFSEGFWWLVIFGIISSIFSGYYYMKLCYLLIIQLKNNRDKVNVYAKIKNEYMFYLCCFVILIIYLFCIKYWSYIFI